MRSAQRLRAPLALAVTLGLALAGTVAPAAAEDAGVSAKKLIVVDKVAKNGKAKLVYLAKKDPGIQKGPGAPDPKTGPQGLAGTFEVFYADSSSPSGGFTSSVSGSFTMPPEWQTNKDNVAKFKNKEAPGGPSEVKVALVKPEKVAKVVAKGLGGLDLFQGPPTDSGGVVTILTIVNDIDNSVHRMCTRFAVDDGSKVTLKQIAGGSGMKLIAKNGVPMTCPMIGTTTTTLPSSTTSTTIFGTTSTTIFGTTTTTIGTSTTSTSLPGSSTTTVTSSTTTTTNTVPAGTVLRFTTAAPSGDCGVAKSGGSGGSVVKTLSCGGLNIGHGSGTVPEGPTPAGADTFFNTDCSQGTCTVTARTAAQTGSNNDCSDTGCDFGPFLPIANPATPSLSTCVHNTFDTPGNGTLDTMAGSFTGAIPLSSQTTVTGNVSSPCPKCVGGTVGMAGSGTCDGSWTAAGAVASPDSGNACTPTNAAGDTYDCRPPQAPYSGVLAPFPVTLSPIGTGQSTLSGATPCPGQTTNGCFGQPTCDYIEENGSEAGTLSAGAHAGTLASVFCIPATGNVLVDGSAGLPGPGATSLPGMLQLLL